MVSGFCVIQNKIRFDIQFGIDVKVYGFLIILDDVKIGVSVYEIGYLCMFQI